MVFDWTDPQQFLVLLAAALLAGGINAIAGGGTIVSFPALLWLGVPPVLANTTNAVGLWPGTISAAWGFRYHIRAARRWRLWLALPSLAGGAVGAWLLLNTPEQLFRSLAPYLVLAATLILALENVLVAEAPHDRRGPPPLQRLAAPAMVFLIALYGGYFGAGIGIMLLAALSLSGLADLHEKNGLKNLFTIAIKAVAVAYFIAAGQVVWSAALLMAAGSVAGGRLGAWVQYRVGRAVTRRIIVIIGVVISIAMLARLV